MEPYIYLSIDSEHYIIIVHRLLFGFSTFFNAIACLCLYRETPDMQSDIKFYLYYMQVLTFLCDVNLDVAVEPFTLLPVFGGYCKGLICGWLSIHYSLMLTFIILSNFCFCINACVLCRHQAIVTGTFKFGKNMNRAIRLVIFMIIFVPSIYGLMTNFDDSESEALINSLNLTWMRERGPHVVYKRTPNTTFTFPL
ncbi:hypothetical protein PENTCL1PPCAC_14092, partial [Pristionchus entomophagus]